MKCRMNFVFYAWLAVTLLSAGQVFAQADWTQRFPSVSPPARSSAGMAQLGNNVVLFGGLVSSSSGNSVLGDTWVWDGSNWSQITSFGLFGTGSHPSARSNAVMAYHPNANVVVLFGGIDANGTLLNDTWLFTLTTNALLKRTYYQWTQVTSGTVPPAREDATMQFDPSSNRLVLATGSNFTGTLSDTWAFDPSAQTWTLVTTGEPTPARATAAMAPCAIDASHVDDRLLLFGGFETVSPFVLGDSWIFRTSLFASLDWGLVTPAVSPPARFRHAMAFYPISNQVVLYGGGGSGVVFSDTWNAFCGSWAQASPAHNPGQRNSMSMAYSNAKFNVVMFGGRKVVNGAFQDSNETWTWGRRAACLPTDGATLPVGSKVTCQFDQIEGVEFQGWETMGFAPPFRESNDVTFHTEAPGYASITAEWADAAGSHSQTYNYTIVGPHR